MILFNKLPDVNITRIETYFLLLYRCIIILIAELTSATRTHSRVEDCKHF